MVFHEPDWESARSTPPAPTYDRCVAWIRDTFRIAGTDSDMAAKLYTAFISAGLPAPSMRMQTFIGGGAACSDFLQAVADLIGIIVPTMEHQAIATDGDARRTTDGGGCNQRKRCDWTFRGWCLDAIVGAGLVQLSAF
jgi:hypothetical protein